MSWLQLALWCWIAIGVVVACGIGGWGWVGIRVRWICPASPISEWVGTALAFVVLTVAWPPFLWLWIRRGGH